MEVKTLVLGSLETNTYLLDYGDDIIVIDPACDGEKIVAQCLNKPISFVLLTHGHFDHCGAAEYLRGKGAKVYISEADYKMIQDGNDLSNFCSAKLESFTPDGFLSEGDYKLGDHNVKVISTPGHTAGGLTFVIEGKIFCGDTLFRLSVGRSDFPTGDKRKLTESVKKLYTLCSGEVLPGHGERTTIEFERKFNPYVKQ